MADKIDDRILQMFTEGAFDTDFINLDLKPHIKKLLLDYQVLHVFNLVSALKKNNAVLDGSHVGTGKTYAAVATIAQLNLCPIIICPKTITTMWQRVCARFNVKPLCIVNYEMIRSGYIYVNEKRIKPTFLEISETGQYKWHLDMTKHIVIFDEAHKCKSTTSQNGKLLLALKNVAKIMLLSATLADTPTNFQVFGYILDFYKDVKKSKNWINGIIRDDISSKAKTSGLSKHLFPNKGSRMTLEDIGDKFPKNQITTECYDIDKEHQSLLDNAYKQIEQEYGDKAGIESLVKITKARKIIELVKVPILIDLIEEYLDAGKSVVIFVNFTATLQQLENDLKRLEYNYSIISGAQTLDERTQSIEDFQKDKTRIILCMIQAGGVGISLDDRNGKFPRISLISPSFSSTELIQALGRIYRASTKTNVQQKIVFCANSHEENIAAKIKEKIKFTNKLTDNDLMCFK